MRPSAKAAAALFVLFTCAYFAAAVTVARDLPLSTDEVFALWIVKLFPAGKVVYALTKGVDSLPPGYYVFLEAVCHFLGIDAFAMRLPSIVAFYVFLLSIFLLLRKYTGPLIAVFAMALPCMTGAAVSATLARPYAIVSACFGLAVLVWTKNSSTHPPPWRAALLTLLLAIAIAIHFYAVLLVVVLGSDGIPPIPAQSPDFLAELGGADRRRRNRLPLVAGDRTHLSNHALDYFCAGFYAKPTLNALLTKFGELFAPERMLYSLLVFLCLAAFCRYCAADPEDLVPQPRGQGSESDSGGDLALVALGAILLPIVTLVFALLVTRSFNTRYFYAAVLGLSMLVGTALRRMPFGNLVAFCMTLVFTVFFCAAALRHSGSTDQRIEVIRQARESLPVVVGDASDYFEMMESAPPRMRNRLVYANMPAGFELPRPRAAVGRQYLEAVSTQSAGRRSRAVFCAKPEVLPLVYGKRQGGHDGLVA